MRLYGSFQNRLMENANQSKYEPQLGDGATEISYSDRTPYTVIRVINPTTVVVQKDRFDWADPKGRQLGDNSRWTFSPWVAGPTYFVTKRKNGRWIVKGEGSVNGTCFVMGQRDKYHDDSF